MWEFKMFLFLNFLFIYLLLFLVRLVKTAGNKFGNMVDQQVSPHCSVCILFSTSILPFSIWCTDHNPKTHKPKCWYPKN
jgi:hypothetical protein